MGAHVSHANLEKEIAPANTKWIWRVFWILLAITAVEFAIAFAKEPFHIPHAIVVSLFVGLTIVKAFYIVAEFMHLGHEVKAFVYSIILPFVMFITWFIIAMLNEGSYTHDQHVKSKMTTTVEMSHTK